ncbi:MAG: polysaccharide pyruvyl transferase family protein, partial [Synergistaceae bacterium]|nr:polysaccharide pyruvyl transferase family protein [Synergistaceae bacterium]
SEDERVRIISKENGGCVSARKAGVRASSGEYICFVDGDDYVNHDMLSNLLECVDSHDERVDIVTSNFSFDDADGRIYESGNNIVPYTLHGDEFFRLIMTWKLLHYVFPRLYRREFLIEAGYLDYPEVSHIEDLMTNAFLGLHNPCAVFSDTVNYFYRYNPDSLTKKSKGTKHFLELVKVLALIEDRLKSEGKYDKYADLINYTWFFYASGVLDFSKPVNAKVKMFEASGPRIKNFKDNPYSREHFAKFGRVKKMRFMLYLNQPYLMYIIDPLLKLGKEIRNMIRKLKAQRYCRRKFAKLKHESKLLPPEKIIYLAAAPDYGNLGEHAIAMAEMRVLHEMFPEHKIIEIDCGTYNRYEEDLKRSISDKSTILITGGGFLGDLWMNMENIVRSVISNYPENKIVILPQSLYFRNKSGIEYENSCRIYRSHKNLKIILRERFSLEEAHKILSEDKTFLLPDMALYLEESLPLHESGKHVLFCMRTDKERILSDDTQNMLHDFFTKRGWYVSETSNITENFSTEMRTSRVTSKLREFHDSDLVITDRLHGMILSVLAGTPCIAFNNLSRKVEGVYSAWLKDNIDYVRIIHNADELPDAFASLGDIHAHTYSASYLDAYKSELREIIENA